MTRDPLCLVKAMHGWRRGRGAESGVVGPLNNPHLVGVGGRVGEVRLAADEAEALDLDPRDSRADLMPQRRYRRFLTLEEGRGVLVARRAVLDPCPGGFLTPRRVEKQL